MPPRIACWKGNPKSLPSNTGIHTAPILLFTAADHLQQRGSIALYRSRPLPAGLQSKDEAVMKFRPNAGTEDALNVPDIYLKLIRVQEWT